MCFQQLQLFFAQVPRLTAGYGGVQEDELPVSGKGMIGETDQSTRQGFAKRFCLVMVPVEALDRHTQFLQM